MSLCKEYAQNDREFVKNFRNIDVKKTGLWVRWLWPDHVEEAELDRELKALSDAGIAGAEIGLHAMGTTWGTDEYFQSLILAMRSAKKYGMKLDFFITVGTVCLPLWVLPVDSDAAEKILFYFDTTVTLPAGASGHDTKVRLGIPKPSKTTVNGRLVAVSYAQVLGQEENFITISEDNLGTIYADSLHLGDAAPASPTTLEGLLGKSQQELENYGYHPDTHKFDIDPMQAHPELFDITVTLPDNTTDQEQKYVIFAYWEVPSDKTFGGVTQYCCDHYSKLGTHAVTDYYDRNVEKFPELGQLFTQVGRCFFGDSLENNGNWTLEILKVYGALFHEDFTPYLYSIANGPWRVRPEMAPPPAEDVTGVVKGKPIDAPPRPPHYGLPFQMPDFSKGQIQYTSIGIEKLRKSYYEAMTHCFIENHVKEYSCWADKYDMDFRCQSTYGQKLYMMEASLNIDIAETESLAYLDEIDGYRAQAASVHMRRNGSKILSSEQGENFEDQFHTTTWSGDFLWRSNRFYAAGGNQLIYHVFSYTKYDTPMTHGNGNMVWPGFRPQPNVGDNLQFNRPTMGYMQDYSKYIARIQMMLRTGEAKLDAAIYYHSYNNDRWDFDAFLHDDSLEKAGYSYEFLDPSFFDLSNAVVKNGVFAPDGPGYRAFLFRNQQALPVEAAEKLLCYATAGLPMVFAGEMPQRAAYHSPNSQADDQRVQEIARQLLEMPNVVQVADVKDWHTALNRLGITPSLQPNGADLLYARRTAEDADYYFLYNQEKYFSRDKMWLPLKDIDTSITLSASKPGRIPYLLNLWSGEIIPIPDYTHVTKDAVVVQLKLTGNDAMAVVLADPDWYDGPVPELAGKPIEELPLENWTLRLLSHEPGEKALSGDDLTDTAIVPLDVGFIGKPKPWTEIAVLPDGRNGNTISGVGIYETDIFWDSRQTKRAVLDLGQISDLYRLTVNGTEVPGANPVYPVQDITRYLRNGENHIRVEAASNFYHAEQSRNYLNTNYVEEKAYTAVHFGLLRPVVLRLFDA